MRIFTHSLHFFTIFSFFTLATLLLPPSCHWNFTFLSHLLCKLFSNLMLLSHPSFCSSLQFSSCLSYAWVHVYLLCLAPCNFLTIIAPLDLTRLSDLHSLLVENLQRNPSIHPILSHKPWPIWNCYFEGHKFSSNECFRTYYLPNISTKPVFSYFVNCIYLPNFLALETLESCLTQAFLNPCLHVSLSTLHHCIFCEFFHILLNSHT